MTINTRLQCEQLAALAEELTGSIGIYARVYVPFDDVPYLDVRNLQHPMCSQRIAVRDGRFSTALGQMIGPVTEPATAAISIVRSVRDGNSRSGEA